MAQNIYTKYSSFIRCTSTYIARSAALKAVSASTQWYEELAPCFIRVPFTHLYARWKAPGIHTAECSSATICKSCRHHSSKWVPGQLQIQPRKEAKKWLLGSAGQQDVIYARVHCFPAFWGFWQAALPLTLLLLPPSLLRVSPYF